LTLQQFESVDLVFDLTVTPGFLDPGDDGIVITSDA
jgi:hypothetical protein